jgi:heat shock protein HslJ
MSYRGGAELIGVESREEGEHMRTRRLSVGLILGFVCISVQAQTTDRAVTVTGRLTRAIGIGGESTGWMLQLEAETAIDGKAVHVIEVAYRNARRLEALENKLVRASGRLTHQPGVETGERTVLEITSIREVKDGAPEDATAGGLSLPGSGWVLEDLAGGGVLDQVQATLTFLEAGKVGGNGSCNRFFGTAEIHGENIKFGPLGATRMACPEPVMSQETKYLRALQGAERFAWKDPYLVIYCKGFEKPLRFTRMPPHKTAPASR